MKQTGIKVTAEELAELQSLAKADVEQLRAIVDAAWKLRREERDYNPCPDLLLRANARERLYELLDQWKAAEAAGEEE